MNIRDGVLGVGAYSFTAFDAAVKLDQNESPFPLPAAVQAELAGLLGGIELHRYPGLQARELAAALARLHGWPEAGVTVAGGSNILIQSLVIAAGIGRTVLTVSPTFSVYALQGRLMADRLVEVPLAADFSLPVEALEAELERGSGVFFLANPAAPTGNLHPAAEIRRLKEAAGDRWLFVIDEAYQQFSGLDLSGMAREEGTVVLRTLSKAAGLAGLRLGYALSSPELGVQLQKVVVPFSVSAVQERVALAVLEHQTELQANVELLIRGRQRLFSGMQSLTGVEAYPSAANFILFRVADAAAVHAGLLEQGVLVRRQDHLPGLEGCLRVSVGTDAETDLFLSALERTLQTVRSER